MMKFGKRWIRGYRRSWNSKMNMFIIIFYFVNMYKIIKEYKSEVYVFSFIISIWFNKFFILVLKDFVCYFFKNFRKLVF